MQIDECKFYETLEKAPIHKRLINSLLPFQQEERPASKSQFLDQLYDDIRLGKYFPSVPRGYIVENKHNYVPRIVSVLSYRDACVYYFCVKQLEHHIAKNRISGTYGGWSLGNSIRELEDIEQEDNEQGMDEEVVVEEGPYHVVGSLNPYKWTKYWKQFQRLAYEKSRPEELCSFIEYDIANFYDSINLDLLDRKIRACIQRELNPVVDLLFAFLRNWNRQFEGYSPKTVGIPQEEIGDCSRILANFYLQDYDSFMARQCRELMQHGEYLRYADDQIVMAEDILDARLLLVSAAQELYKLGLCVNSGKVNEFKSREGFEYYWSFDLFALLGDEGDVDRINEGARTFLDQKKFDEQNGWTRPWRWHSVLKRIINVGVEKIEDPWRAEVVGIVLEKDYIPTLKVWMMRRLASSLLEAERERLFIGIDSWIPTLPFNSFHLNVRRFYSKEVPSKDLSIIDERIEELRDWQAS
jgi:hypothetical protein